MKDNIKLVNGESYRIPDGYKADGSSRPYRAIKLSSVQGNIAHFIYLDNKERGVVPTYGIKYYHI
jgi:hypothetical protein